MKNKIAIFPGSFDPITNGHINLVERSIPLFEKIIIGVGANSQKQSMFSLELRIKWLTEIFAGQPNVEVESYNGLTIDFCKNKNAVILLRGLRSSGDFEFEKSIALINRSLAPEVETIFLLSIPEYAHISSTIVRELIKHQGKIDHLVPACVINDMQQQFRHQ